MTTEHLYDCTCDPGYLCNEECGRVFPRLRPTPPVTWHQAHEEWLEEVRREAREEKKDG